MSGIVSSRAGRWRFLFSAGLLCFTLFHAASHAVESRKLRESVPDTFVIEEAGIELKLREGWFPQPLPPGSRAIKMLVSLRDLSKIAVSLIPFQVAFNEDNVDEMADELIGSMRDKFPDFFQTERKLVPGVPARLHVEGTRGMEGKTALVCIEVFPVKAKTALLVLTTQKTSGLKFSQLADLIENELKIMDGPLETPSEERIHLDIGGAAVLFTPPDGWRPALEEEVEAAEPGTPAALKTLVYPTLADMSPTIVFGSLPDEIAVGEQNLAAFEAMVRGSLPAESSATCVKKVSIEPVGGISSFMVEGTAQRAGFTAGSRQLFVPLSGRTLIMSLSFARGDAARAARAFSLILDGLAFEGTVEAGKAAAGTPPPETRPGGMPGAYWIYAAAVLLVVLFIAVLLVARRKKL
ncbi:MAG: hypothetical protein ABIJ56_09445 [Pseudomonadota bacterium]